MLQPDDPSPLNSLYEGPVFSHYPAIAPPAGVSLTTLQDHPCSYFPDRTARSRAVWAARLPGHVYRQFMDAGFRRSGKVIYQPICARCRACVPIRVPVDRFEADKSQRRCRRKNQDLMVSIAPPEASDEAYALYMRYVRQWHGRETEEDSREGFERFLYESPVESVEFKYRDASGALRAVGICDVAGDALSSVYFYFDPQESHRSLGTFGALFELEHAKAQGLKHYYLGYWIEGCDTMQYKNRFRPYELLGTDGIWAGAS